MSQSPETTVLPLPSAVRPRVLVADDDATSCRFLGDGLRSLGAVVDVFVDGAAALAHAHLEKFDLLLLDCRMPRGGARHILATLRADARARSAQSAAVATSAELANADRRQLLAAGFSDTLLKPCSLTDLRRVLAVVAPGPAPRVLDDVLDDAAALHSSGDHATMLALRRLLREELAVLLRELDDLSQDLAAFGERLHRLRSSCGFCGVTALATQVVLMKQQLAEHGATPSALASFRLAIANTLRALDG